MGRHLFPVFLKITLGRVTLQQAAAEPSLAIQEMVRSVCTLPSQSNLAHWKSVGPSCKKDFWGYEKAEVF